MSESSSENQEPISPGKFVPPSNDPLRPVLDRIAAALEKRNFQAEKQAATGEKKEGGDDKEGGKKEGDGDKEKKPGKAKRFFKSAFGLIVILALLALLIIGGLALWHYEKTHESTDDAYTTGHVHQVSPRVSGLVVEVWVDDNQQVRKGDLLVKLDPRDYEVALQRAHANLEQAQSQVLQAQAAVTQADAAVTQSQAQVAQARAQVDQAGANYEVSGINYGRASSLYGKDLRAVAKADVDTNKSNLDATKAGFDAAKANAQAAESNVKAVQATRESRAADVEAARSMVDVAKSNVEDAKLQLSYCWVLAPMDGRVSRKTVETGFRVSAGQALLAVTENIVWVLANMKETQLQHIRVGQTVEIPIDAFKKHPFTGRVDSIQNGSGATYSLLPPDNATGNFTKIVQRVPVKITFNADSIKGWEDLLVPGLSCEPVIDLSTTSDRGDHVSKNQPAPPAGKNQQ